MALYYDAATILSDESQNGSLKSRIFDKKINLRSKPAHLYALISETAKYDTFLKAVIDNAGFLAQEPKLTPTLALLLVHDHLFSKSGIAASASHHLRQAIERHKARLQAEFSKARLKRRCVTVEELKQQLLEEKPSLRRLQPRWVRINTLKSDLSQELSTTFKGYRSDATISEVAAAPSGSRILAIDSHVPDLVATPPDANFTGTRAYTDGAIILQDKASCFPAYLLAGGNNDTIRIGDFIDGCAAPGNKTSHLAALCQELRRDNSQIYACERDNRRSKVLSTMMAKTGASNAIVLERQDFLALDPQDVRFKHVTHLLLDPSCSGSGILGREDMPSLALPVDPKTPRANKEHDARSSKKRKRGSQTIPSEPKEAEIQAEETKDSTYDPIRLQKLASLQTRIVEHALSFPAATRVTYSTCSIHVEENEAVVSAVLASSVARSRGWRVLRRQEQVAGLRKWEHRGVETSSQNFEGDDKVSGESTLLDEEAREACIRCYPGDDMGTMGFFLCGFARFPHDLSRDPHEQDEEDWGGFSD